MLYLLTSTSVFASLPNNCYCQITGRAMNDLIGPKAPLKQHAPSSLSSRKRPAAALDTPIFHGSSMRPTASDTCPSPAKSSKMKKGNEKKPASKDSIPLANIFFRRAKIFYVQKRRYDDGQFHCESRALFAASRARRLYGLDSVTKRANDNADYRE